MSEEPERRKRSKPKARSYRGREWDAFQEIVANFVEIHTVPKHGDYPHDRVMAARPEDCLRMMRAIAERFGSGSRRRVTHLRQEDRRDLLKIAHLACMAYFKLAEAVETTELRQTFQIKGSDIYLSARRYGKTWIADCPHPVHAVASAPSMAIVDPENRTFFCPTCKWGGELSSVRIVDELVNRDWMEYGTTGIPRGKAREAKDE